MQKQKHSALSTFSQVQIADKYKQKWINKQDAYCVQIETMASSISSTLSDTKDGSKDTKLFLNTKVSTI
jgi:hypothetical protein